MILRGDQRPWARSRARRRSMAREMRSATAATPLMLCTWTRSGISKMLPLKSGLGNWEPPAPAPEQQPIAVRGHDAESRIGAATVLLGHRADRIEGLAATAALQVGGEAVERDDAPVLGVVEHGEEGGRLRRREGDRRGRRGGWQRHGHRYHYRHKREQRGPDPRSIG